MTEKIECSHVKDTPKGQLFGFGGQTYHVVLCPECYGHFTMPVFRVVQDMSMAEWKLHYAQAQWLLAEKDNEIAELREQIELMEAEELRTSL